MSDQTKSHNAGSRTYASSSSVGAAATAPSKLVVGARCTIAQDTDIRGTVHIGDGTIVHPKASIQAVGDGAKIVIGSECIIEELAQIVYRGTGTMTIGDRNLFQVGCRIESSSIGSHNTFECRSRTTDSVTIKDFSTIGAGCIAQPPAQWEPAVPPLEEETAGEGQRIGVSSDDGLYAFPSRTVIYGEQSSVRIWSGNGVRLEDALHAKHLDHLRRNLPEYHSLRIIR